ncbi:MAG TPA: hypothetical protein VGT41_02805, partial [Candidatus Babeliales bacterium]|nr:hypothetical protein [Candidatus Babeliales bacterium]
MMNVLNFIGEIIKSNGFALTVLISSSIIKIYLLKKLIPLGFTSSVIRIPWFLLLSILIGSLFGDIAWVIKLIHKLFLFDKPYTIVVFWTRISWAFVIIQYQSFGLFIESFFLKSFSLNNRHKITVLCSTIYSLYFFVIAFFDSNLTDIASRDHARTITDPFLIPLEIRAMRHAILLIFFLHIIPSAISMLHRLRKNELPMLLKHQIKIIICYLFTPYVCVEAMLAMQYLSQVTQHNFTAMQHNFTAIVAVSTIFITYAVAYCMHTITKLRFLNTTSQVESPYSDNFIYNFKTLLEACSHITKKSELTELTKNFFEQTFAIHPDDTTLIICSDGAYSNSLKAVPTPHHTEILIKQFLSNADQEHYLKKQKILLYNEIEFSQFYQDTPLNNALLEFLKTLNAEMFIPVYQHGIVIAYIIINRQKNGLYGNHKQDEIIVFARYLK